MSTPQSDAGDPVRVAFVHEVHLGHQTYAENLRSAAAGRPDLDVTWIPVTYDRPHVLLGALPGQIGRSLVGRSEVLAGLTAAEHDVHLFNTQVPAALGGRAARSRPYVVITDVTPRQYDRIADGYGHRPDRPGPLAWWKHRVNRRTFAAATWCVGWSNWVAGSFADDYGVDRERIAVIPPGVDTDRWRPGDRDTGATVRVLFVGGDFVRKGGDLLLGCLAALPDHVELDIVTRSPVPVSERVRVHDDLGPNDPRLLALFRSADVFAMPSRAEAFGIAAAEASAAGLPVIASDVGGLADIVADGETGLVVPPGDGGALAGALVRLVDDAGLRARMGAAARRRAVERFDAGTNAGRLFDLAVDAASGAGGGPRAERTHRRG